MFEPYKPEQAKTTRTVTFLCGLLLIVWGSRSFIEHFPRLIPPLQADLQRSLNAFAAFGSARGDDAWRIDLLLFETNVSIAFVAGALLLIGSLAWWYRFLNRPRYADMLIEMDAELRKVSWPSHSDAWQSTLVVTGCTVVLVVLLFAYDIAINRFMQLFVTAG